MTTPERQLDNIPVDKHFIDKASGRDTLRPQLDAMLSFAREGDTVVVHSMDCPARNLDDLRRLAQQLTKRGIRIEFVTECLSFTGEDSPMANLLLSVMGQSMLSWLKKRYAAIVSPSLGMLSVRWPLGRT